MIGNIKMNFFAVVVLYNTFVNDSITIKNLKSIHSHSINIVVVDNSTKDMKNEEETKANNWVYLSMNGNKGLSKAYNCALEYLKNKEGIVIWFDDDTNVTQEYFDELELNAEKYEDADIFVPVIQGQDGKYWSPNEARFLKNKQMKASDQNIPNNRINAINSCTAVRLSVYDDYRYDERLFLDQVDHNFFYDQRKLNRKVEILKVVIHHNFSTKSKMKNIDAVKTRYRIMIPDFLMYCSKTRSKYFLGLIKVAGWGIREGIKYRNAGFLFWTLNEARMWKEKQKV